MVLEEGLPAPPKSDAGAPSDLRVSPESTHSESHGANFTGSEGGSLLPH